MLQRLLAEFLHLEGLSHAMMIDDRGLLLSSVCKQGVVPSPQHLVEMTSAALNAAQHNSQGELWEIWIEGKTTTLIDILTPYRILMLQGQSPHLAKWRHRVDKLRQHLATTPEL